LIIRLFLRLGRNPLLTPRLKIIYLQRQGVIRPMMLTFSNIYKARLFWIVSVFTAMLVVFCVPIALAIRELDVNTLFISPLEITNLSRLIILCALTFFIGVCLFLFFSKKIGTNHIIMEHFLFGNTLIFIGFFAAGLFRQLYLNSGLIMTWESLAALIAVALCFFIDICRRYRKMTSRR
jgi:hypothetical protein